MGTAAKKAPARRVRRAPAKRAAPKMTLEKKIKAISLSEQEQKLKTYTIINADNTRGTGLLFGAVTGRRGLYVPNILSATDLNLAQGTNQETRIGNEIHNVKLNVKGFIHSEPQSNPANISPYPFEVHLLFYKRKNSTGNDPDSILQYPDNTNGSITGNATTSMLPWNRKDYVIKKHRIFKMKANPATATSTAPNAIGVENPSFNAGDYQFFKRFSIDVPIKEKLLFNDAGTSPNNEWVAMGIYIVNGDGTTLLNLQQRAQVSAVATLRYKDA